MAAAEELDVGDYSWRLAGCLSHLWQLLTLGTSTEGSSSA